MFGVFPHTKCQSHSLQPINICDQLPLSLFRFHNVHHDCSLREAHYDNRCCLQKQGSRSYIFISYLQHLQHFYNISSNISSNISKTWSDGTMTPTDQWELMMSGG